MLRSVAELAAGSQASSARPTTEPGPVARGRVGLGRAALMGVALVVCGSACLWRSYEEILSVHVQVLSSMAEKAVDGADPNRRPSASDVAELLYPLRRARQFAEQYEAQRDRASYQAFVALLDLYEHFVQGIDVARTEDDRWAALEPHLAEQRQGLEAAIGHVRDALGRERGEAGGK